MSNYIIEKLNIEAQKDKVKFIEKNENKYFKQLTSIVKDAIKNQIKFIFVAGPSSSGKTTTAKYLCKILEEFKVHSNYISLDDFFVDRDKTPLLPNGEKDYENLTALDKDEIQRCLTSLTKNGVAYFPKYDFFTGVNTKNVNRVEIKDNSIIVIEGNHAFNPFITGCIGDAKKMRVFIYPEHQFADKDRNVIINPIDLRLIRRTIRDVGNRGYAPTVTFNMWNNVLEGEKLFILPYKHLADYVIDTTYGYECMIYKPILSKLLKHYDFEICKKILNQINHFESIEFSLVPEHSLMWEFLSNLKVD